MDYSLEGCEKFSPYDIIIFLGSLNEARQKLLNQLSNNGKLMICENYNFNLDESKLVMYTKVNNKILKHTFVILMFQSYY